MSRPIQIFSILIAFVIISIILSEIPHNKLSNTDNWQGFYYPNGCLGCKEHHIISPIHKTKNECFVWADEVHKRRNYNTNDTYECGKNCKKHESLDISICEETVNTKGSTETI